MSIIDCIIILFLLSGAVLGFKKGAIKSLVTLLGTIISVIVAYYLKNPVASVLFRYAPFLNFTGAWTGLVTLNILLYEAIAYILVFLVLSSVLSILIKISGVIEHILNATIILGIPSKIIGAVLGFLESLVFSFIVLFILLQFNQTNKIVNDSSLARSIVNKTPIIGSMVDDTYQAIMNINKLQEKYKNTENKDDYNAEILEIMLKYEVITKKELKELIDNKKLTFNGVQDILDNY